MHSGWQDPDGFDCLYMEYDYMCILHSTGFGTLQLMMHASVCSTNRACAGGCCVCALNNEAPNLSRAVDGGR